MTIAKPRILHVITRLDPGGSATNTIVSADRLRKHGFEISLAYGPTSDPDGAVMTKLKDANLDLLFIPHLVRNISPVTDWLALQELKRIIRNNKFDLIHTHTSKAGVLGRMAASSFSIPAVHTPHGHIFYGYFGRILTSLFIYAERLMAGQTKKIISLTDIETRESLENGIGKASQYVTIHSGVPLSSMRNIPSSEGSAFRCKHAIPENAFLFVSIGRLVPIKGFDLLLNAFARADFSNKPVYLAIIGDGEEMPNLRHEASRLNIEDKVRFTGALEDVRPALAAANIFVLASRNEGMGRVFVEAMAAGLPAIGTAVGGIPSLVIDGKTGLLALPENTFSLAGAMEKALSDREALKIMGDSAAKMVFPEYDEDTMIERLAALYREVLGSTVKGCV